MTYQQYLNNHLALQKLGLITQRVFPLPERVYNHSVISKYIADETRNLICTSGRQSFKSEIAKRKIMISALANPNWRILIGMPTQAQVKRIYWDGPLNVPDMFPDKFIRKIRDSEMRLELINGTQIELFSAETVQRAEGSWAHLVLLDECGDMNIKEVWQRSISPMLVPTKGKLYLIGVPRQNMSGEYKEIWQEYGNKEKHPDWNTYTWPSADTLDPDEIDRIKSQIDPLLYEQEFMGKFHEGVGGRAFHQFNRELHIKNVEFNEMYPVFVGCDFNTNIMSWTVSQIMPDGFINAIDEVVTQNTNVFKQVPALQKKIIDMVGDEVTAKNRGVIFTGDYTGTNNTVSSRGSVWSEILQLMRHDGWKCDTKIKPNPVLDRRISSTNARLKSADGKIHVGINERCKRLIRDFELVSMADLVRDKVKLEKAELTHASDGFSYLVWYYYPALTYII